MLSRSSRERDLRHIPLELLNWKKASQITHVLESQPAAKALQGQRSSQVVNRACDEQQRGDVLAQCLLSV